MRNAKRLRDYQQVGVKFCQRQERCGLWLEMGLGKTATILSAVEPTDWGRVLVVAPKRVAEETWPEELEKWRPDLSVAMAVGSAPERREALLSGADVTVISRDNAREAVTVRDGRRIVRWESLVYDESSGLKNKSSGRWKVARTLSGRGHRTVLMTGTPAPNSLEDVWAPLYLLDNGERLGTTLTEFRARHFRPVAWTQGGIVTKREIIEGMDLKIHRKVQDIVLGMQGEGRIALPPLTLNPISMRLPPLPRALYVEMRAELAVDLADIFGVGEIHTAGNAAILSSKLSQISSGGLYADRESERAGQHTVLHKERINILREIVEGNGGSPVLVFYRFRFEAEYIREAFPEARSIQERGVIKEWNSGTVPLLYGHPASAGHGLNLQYGGHTIVWTSPTWELELWDQANARLNRPGQTKPVIIHTILGDGTVDTQVVNRLQEKSSVQTALKDAVESPV